MICNNRDIVILCDRGLMDGCAYVSKNQWEACLEELGLKTIQLRENRYDGILHLVTAADGAEEFYELETNEARYEGLEAARLLDDKLKKAYFVHPKWYMVDNRNSKDFDHKIERCK